MCTLYTCRTLNVTMYVCALENHELERVLNIIYDSFAISVVSPFNIYYCYNIYEFLLIINKTYKAYLYTVLALLI